VGPLSVAVIGAVTGAVFGAIGAIATTNWVTRKQLEAQARYRAETNLRNLLKGIAARLEIERRGGYQTIATNKGPFDINHREQFAIEALRNLADLPNTLAGEVEDGLAQILGEEAVLYCDARAYFPDGDVDINAEHAAKSMALINKIHSGTFQTGLIPEIGKRFGDDREQAFDQAIAAINELRLKVGDKTSGRRQAQ
jgi:hypothetical protein